MARLRIELSAYKRLTCTREIDIPDGDNPDDLVSMIDECVFSSGEEDFLEDTFFFEKEASSWERIPS